MEVVLDTNVFISGFFWNGSSRRILDLWRKVDLNIVISMEIISEIVKVLKDFKIQMPDDKRKNLIDLIVSKSIIVTPNEKLNVIKDDPDDNKFLEAAISGKASYIITQDKHLLKIKQFKDIKIINPEEFLILFEKDQ